MSTSCPSCGEYALEQVAHYAQDQLVCTKCGAVAEETTFADTAVLEGTTMVFDRNYVNLNVKQIPKSLKYQSCSHVAKGKLEGIERIKLLASTFHLNSEMTEAALQLFSQVVTKPIYLFNSIKTKIILAGCCVYIVIRQHNWPVLISYICNFLQCSGQNFNQVYKTLLNVIDIQILTSPLEELVPVVLNNIEFKDDQNIVIERTLNIISLAKNCWLTSGRSPRNVIFAASYLAWKSLDPNRCKITYPAFCRQVNMESARKITYSRSLKEMTAALMKLAEKIPWVVKGTINQHNVTAYLDSILKYSTALRRDVVFKNENSNINDIEEFSTFRIASKKPRMSLSPSEIEPPDKIVGHDELNDVDFSDSEIDKFIRTESEVAALQEFMEKCEK